jgi:outer membrane protein OmpA-like peptidoglycan-associated protein
MRRALHPALFLLAALAAAPAQAQPGGPLIIEGDGQSRRIDCAGRDVVVRGARNQITFTGGCRALEVQGDASQIQAELAPGARVSLQGNAIDLRWAQQGEGQAPRITTQGRQIAVQQVPRIEGAAASGLARRDTARGVQINLSGDVLFASGADRLRPDAARGLQEVAALIRDLKPRALTIIGYTDSVGGEAANRDLSLRRARAVQSWLQEHAGGAMPPVVVEGRGEADPVAGNDTDEGRAQNRRVEFFLER